jgi:hypothetical protein
MAMLKGKFITMACSLLELNPKAKLEVAQGIKDMTGMEWKDLPSEDWFEAEVEESIFKVVEKHNSPVMAASIIKAMGRRVFPTISKTTGFPEDLKTPLDFLKWEGESFLRDHKGSDVVPRKFIKTDPGHVIVEAVSPGYNCIHIEGVFEGILKMCKINEFKVEQTRCVKNGDPVCEYDITWEEA